MCNRHCCYPTTAFRVPAKKISHNLIPQQCKPKHFPATQNAILRIYFGSQREWYVNFTLFLAVCREILGTRFAFLLQFHWQFHQFVKWNYREGNNSAKNCWKNGSWALLKDKTFQRNCLCMKKKGVIFMLFLHTMLSFQSTSDE